MRSLKSVNLVALIAIMLVALLAAPALAASPNAPAAASNSSTTNRSSGNSPTTSSSNQECDGDSGGHSDTGHGANQNGPNEVDGRGPYDNTCGQAEDPASQNGNGGGQATGRPEAGSVGQADDKNPPGQNPNAAEDGNNGYECDGNNGIAKTNPAHTGCATASSNPTLGAFASIGTVDCSDNIAEVLIRNDNNSVAGSRTFTVTFDGADTDYVLASGASQTINLTIPDDGQSHSVKVESSGMTDKTASRRIPSNCDELDLGASASIGSVSCTDNVAEVTLNNLNETAAGDRSFLLTFNGVSTTYSVSAGGSQVVNLTIPNTGTSNISVSSLGMTTESATRSIPSNCGSQAGSARIGSIDCTDNTAEVVLNNANTAGDRIFDVTANGLTTSYVVAPGSSRVLQVEFPKVGGFTKAGSYPVTVSSSGISDVVKTLTTPACVLGVQFQNSLKKSVDVLGGTLARTGSDPGAALMLALILLAMGLALEMLSKNAGRPLVMSAGTSWASYQVIAGALSSRRSRFSIR